MSDREKNHHTETDGLDEKVSSGRITAEEAQTIRRFFASERLPDWPTTQIQQRMQGSGG